MGLIENLFGRGRDKQPQHQIPSYNIDQHYSPGDIVCSNYEVKLKLGQGGMGEVYLVEDTSNGKLCAAKVVRTRSSASAADLVGFRQEVSALLKVGTHPFIVRFLNLHEHARDTVLIMEYVAPSSGCTTARDHIIQTQDYTDKVLGMWAVQFCVGIEHAIKCGLEVHRDIKPDNLLIESGVFLKIADFGLALAVDRHPAILGNAPKDQMQLQLLKSADGRLTCGTPGYIAPELFVGGNASAQSDMFSFGVTLWQLAARSMTSPYKVEYQGDPVKYQQAILLKIITHEVQRINSPYFDVIHRCLAPDPAHRFRCFADLREAIKSAAKAANLGAMDFIVADGFHGSFTDYINRGRTYLVLGQNMRALRILNEAVQHVPNSPEALLARGDALLHNGQIVNSIQDYEKAHRIKPEWDAPLTGLASSWLELEKHLKALTVLEKVLNRHPSNLNGLLLKARVLSMQGKNQDALSLIEHILALQTSNSLAHEYHGRVLWNLEKIKEAEKAFNICLQIDPLALDARLALASLLTERKDVAAAEMQYNNAFLLFQSNSEVLNKIAAHMVENGHAKKAIEVFQSLMGTDTKTQSTLLVNIGNAYLKLGNRDSAMSSFRQAIKIESGNALAYSRIGDLKNEDGDYENAAVYYAKACELKPDNHSYHAEAGTAYLRIHNFAKSKLHFKRSLELFPEQQFILYNLAVAYSADGTEEDLEAAIEALEGAVDIDSKYARGWFLKAHLEATLGRVTDSIASARQAMANKSSLSTDEIQRLNTILM